MQKKICDKCKKEMPLGNKNLNSKFPAFRIVRCDFLLDIKEVDLCHECEKEFDKWLKEK